MRYSDFSGGLWLPNDAEFAVPPEGLLRADNVEYMVSGGIMGRRGRTLRDEAVDPALPVRYIYRFYRKTGTPQTLVFYDAGGSTTLKVFDADGSTVVATVTGLADTDAYHAVTWPAKDKVFVANGVDVLKSWDGTTYATVPTTASNPYSLDPPKGPYIALHKSRLWLTDPDELKFSVYASAVNDETDWPPENQLQVSDPGGGTITGLQSIFDFFVIFKDTSIYRFIGDISGNLEAKLVLYSTIGCNAPRSISRTPFGIIFGGERGIFVTDAVQPAPDELSLPIQSIWTGRASNTAYADMVGTWYPRREQYIAKLDPDDDEAYILTRRQVLVTDISLTGERSRNVWAWAKHTDFPATTMEVFDGNQDAGELVSGDAAGDMWTHDSGTQDDGEDYAVTIETNSRALHPEFWTGRVYRAHLLHRANVAGTVNLHYDDSDSNDVALTIGDTTLDEKYQEAGVYTFDKMGRMVRATVSFPSGGPAVEIHALDLDVRFRSPRLRRARNP